MTAVEFSPQERATLERIEAAEPAPESWAIVQRNPYQLHLHNGEPCCLADADGEPIGPACGTARAES